MSVCGEYRAVQTRLWASSDVRPLPMEDKLLFVYLITAPSSHMSGIYYLRPEAAAAEVGYPIDGVCHRVSDGLLRLEEKGLIRWDPSANVVWVIQMLSYQNMRGSKAATHIARYLQKLPRTPLINEFLWHYVALGIPHEPRENGVQIAPPSENLDTPSKGYAIPHRRGMPYPMLAPVVTVKSSQSVQSAQSVQFPGLSLESPPADGRAEFGAEAFAHLNRATGRAFRADSKTSRNLIAALWRAGHRQAQVAAVIDAKVAEWAGTDMEKFLRPETLFGGKFQGYLDAAASGPAPKRRSSVAVGGVKLAEGAFRYQGGEVDL